MVESVKAFRVRITGRVQGVAYRAWAQGQAERLGLSGWVRNEPDGSVAALIIGPGQAVSEMLEAMRRGPPLARVAGVESEPASGDERQSGFRIAY